MKKTKNKKPVKIKRAVQFNEKVAEKLLIDISNGKSVRRICENPPMPTRRTFYIWIQENEDFRKRYAEAKELCAENLAEEIIEIADDANNDFLVQDSEYGQRFVSNNAKLERAKIRIDARKWMAAKLLPKKYGNAKSVDLTTNGKDIILPIYGGKAKTGLEDDEV